MKAPTPMLLLALAGVAVGCAELLEIEALPGPAPPASHFLYEDGACEACVLETCAEEEARCAEDPQCAPWATCVARCPRGAFDCRAGCRASHGERGEPPSAVAFDACRREACAAACYGAESFVASLVGGPCSACIDLACGAHALTCVADPGDADRPGCEAQWACVVSRPDPDPQHVLDCREGYPHPNGPERLLDVCRWESCRLQCPFGTHWWCLDRYTWRPAEGDRLSLAVYVKSGTTLPDTYATLDRATVKACRADDCERCEDPLAVGLGDIGEVPAILDLPEGLGAFDGCLHLEQASHHPTIHWFGRPLTRPEGRLTVGMLRSLGDLEPFTGVAIDPERGTVYVKAWDCLHDPAYGLTFEVSGADERSTSAYMQGTWIWPEVTGQHTLRDGRGGVFNVPVGHHEVIARRLDGVEVARANIVVRAGWVSQLWLTPRPAE